MKSRGTGSTSETDNLYLNCLIFFSRFKIVGLLSLLLIDPCIPDRSIFELDKRVSSHKSFVNFMHAYNESLRILLYFA